jgi:hypothetical protein
MSTNGPNDNLIKCLPPDIFFYEISDSLSPRELCYCYRSSVNILTDDNLKKSIKRTIAEQFCQFPKTCFKASANLQEQENILRSQQANIANCLEAYFNEQPRQLFELKEIYHGMMFNLPLIKEKIIPALFENASDIKQHRAFFEIAKLSTNYKLFAIFILEFAIFIGKDIDAQDLYGNSALAAMLHEYAKDPDNSDTIKMIDFLIGYGANVNKLHDHNFKLFEAMEPKSTFRRCV